MLTAAEVEGRTLYPLSDLLDSDDLPGFEFDFGDAADLLGKLLYTDAAIEPAGDAVRCEITLVVPEELSLSFAGTDSFEFVLGGTTGLAIFRLSAVLGSELSLTVEQLEFAVRFPPSMLERVSDGKGAAISVTADVRFDSSLRISLENMSGGSLEKCRLVGTEVQVEATNVKLSLNEADPIPEVATQQGFRGIYFDKLSVEIPGDYLDVTTGSLSLEMKAASIGTTGFTGAVTFPATGSATGIEGTLLGFPFRLRRIELDFVQNAIRKAELAVDVRLEYFETGTTQRWAALDISLNRSGSFSAALSAAQPQGADTSASAAGYALSLPIQGVMRLDVASLAVEKQEDDWTVWLGGGMTPLFDGADDWPSVAFDRIGFTPEPRLLIPDGAGVELASPLDVEWNNFQVSITKLRLSFADAQKEPDRKRLALSASVHFGLGLPAGASVKGMTIDWGAGKPVSISFEGIGIEFGVPGTFLFEGEVEYTRDGGAHEFRGSAGLDLIPLDASVDIAIVIGHQPVSSTTPVAFNYLYLYADAKLMPSGIPVGNTGLAIYGFAGLVAYNMTLSLNAALPPDERFYELFTRAPGVGIQQQQKWTRLRGQHALGIGISLGTADTGFSFNLKGLLAVTFPDVNVLLQSRADFLKVRTPLAGAQQGTFDSLLAYSSRERTFSFDVKARYLVEGILTVDGRARAFFDFDDVNAWYLELGRKDDMVAAHLVKYGGKWLFDGGFWFRVDPVGIGTGAELRIDLYKQAAGFWVRARGTAGGEMRLYWDPKQWEGRLWLSGELGAGYQGIGITVTLDGEAQARTARPLYFYMWVEACIRIQIWKWHKDICRGFAFKWEQAVAPQLQPAWGQWSAKPRRTIALPTSTTSGQPPNPVPVSYELPPGTTTQNVPMDAELVLDFVHPMAASVFDDRIALNDSGFETIGGESGYAAAYRLDSVTLVRDPDGTKKALDLFGTWQRGLSKPNLRLKLLSDDHFSHDGSISKTFLEEQAIDYCDKVEDTVKCIALDNATVEPGSAVWVDGVLVEASGGVEPGAGGTDIPSGETVTVHLPPAEGVTVTTTGGDGTVDTTWGGEPTGREPIGRPEVPAGREPPIREPVPPTRPCPEGLCGFLAGSPGRAAALLVAYLLLWGAAAGLLSRGDFGVAGSVGLGLLVVLAVLVTLVLALLLCVCCRDRVRPDQPAEITNIREPAGEPSGEPGDGREPAREPGDTRQPGDGPRPDLGTSGRPGAGAGDGGEGNDGADAESPPGGAGTVTVDQPTDNVVITGGASGTTVTAFCWKPGHGPQQWGQQSQRGGWISTKPAWDVAADRKLMHPNTTYELAVKHTARLRRPGGQVSDYPQERKARLKTSGPPRRALSLTPYVREQYPSSGQRPVFTKYDIALAFNEIYVDLMYWIAGDRLVFRLFDKDGEPILDASGKPVTLTNPWEEEPSRWVDVEEQTWTQLMQENVTRGCIEGFLAPKTANTKKTRVYVSDPSGYALTPNSAYDVWLVAQSQPATALYRWGFTTSAYGTFTDLVTSGGKEPPIWTSQITTQAAGTSTSLGFDALASAFGAPLVAYVERLEVTAIVASGAIHCLLIESPEPLAIGTRTNMKVGTQSLQAVVNGDGTRAFLFRTGGQQWQKADTTLRVTFNRDAGAALPVLTVAGDKSQEVSDLVLHLGAA
jgi:hypothetical protein